MLDAYTYLDGGAKACSAYDAHFMLVDVVHVGHRPPITHLHPYKPSWTNESTLCFTHVHKGIQYAYAALGAVYAYTPTIMAAVGSMLSGNFRVGLSPVNHRDYYDPGMEYEVLPAKLTADQLSDAVKQLPRTRITQDHHLYISRHELKVAYEQVTDAVNERRRAIEELLYDAQRYGLDNQVTFITFAMYVLLAPLFAVRLLMTVKNASHDAEHFNWLLKAEGGAAKQNQTVFRNDLAAVFELQVLRNRAYDTVDWETEIAHRVSPATVPFTNATVFKRAARIFAIARSEGRTAKKLKWREYWANRISAMPNGSVVSQYSEDRDLKRLLPFDGRVKSAWFASNTHSQHEYWLGRTPEIYASTSTKYEWGKVRALYGCDVTSFLHADFSMKMVENTLPSYFPVGERANDKYVGKILDRMNYGVPFCYDYDDFNSQHSVSSMQAVIDAWAAVYGDQLTTEQLESLAWTKQSIAQQKVYFNEVKRTVQVNGTLLSGWRLTSFINTVLNRVYLEEAGLLENVEYAVHNGDDMYASCDTVLNAMKVVKKGKELQIRAQVAKTNIGTIGEFLRVDARATHPNGAQYLARAVATAVHGRVEIGKANDARNALQASEVRAKAIIARGGTRSLMKTVLSAQNQFLQREFRLETPVVEAFRTYHPLQGGWNSEADIGECKLRSHNIPESHRDVDTLRREFNLVYPGARDYVKQVCRALKLQYNDDMIPDMVTNYADSLLRWKTSYEIVIDEESEYNASMRGLLGIHRDDPALADIAKARQVGLGVMPAILCKDTPLTRSVAMAKHPYKYLAAVTSG